MKKVVINENEKGLMFRGGRLAKVLGAGSYYEMGGRTIEKVSVTEPVKSAKCTLERLLANPTAARQTVRVEVKDEQLALHYINGQFDSVLRRGRYAFWKEGGEHEFRRVDISRPEVAPDFPRYLFGKMPLIYFTKVEVGEYQRARLYYDQKLVRILEPGTYYFWKTHVKVNVDYVDIRLTQMNITGQEILTQDKVSLRVNFICNYKVTDYVKVLTEIDDYKEQIHVTAQLALRDYVGKYKLDEILADKEAMSQYVYERLKAKEKELYVEFADAGVKDIILPGEIREIMNTVLVAEKRAQANVITRREEVASTRSLLNTAKLMDENQTLYKLKELEYVERICENVGNINLSGNGDILNQLRELLRGSGT